MKVSTKRSETGFTLIEMLVVTVIAGIAVSGIWEYSVFQKRMGQTLSDRIEYQSQTSRVMAFLGNDIAKAGYGLMEIPGTATPKMSEIMANDMALSLLDNNDHPSTRTWLDSISMLSGVVPVAGADQLVLGATIFSDANVTRKMGVVLKDSGTNFADIYHMEGSPFFALNDYFYAIQPTSTSVNAGGAADVNLLHQVYRIDSIGTGVAGGLNSATARRITYTNMAVPANLTSLPAGSELYGMDYTTFTLSAQRQRFTKIQYALIQSGRTMTNGAQLGKLVRYRFKGFGGTYTAANVEAVVVSEDVIDFQVQYLVWPCSSGATVPQWVNQPDASTTGFYDMSVYAPATTTMTSPYVNRRMRVLGVRVLVFAAAEKPLGGKGLHQIHLPTGLTTYQVANHVITGLDTNRHYILHEEVFDPINFRFRDELWLINDAAVNSLVMAGTTCQIIR